MNMFRHKGPRTRRLVSFLKRRARGAPRRRPEMDCRRFPALFRKRAVVFTALDPATLEKVVAYKVVPFGTTAIPVQRLKLS